jgi:hypothetical protein
VIPGIFAVTVFGVFAYRIDGGFWLAVLGICLSLAFCALLHGGLVISHEGIEWYILRPKWRYRFIPWHVVLDVRKSLFGVLHPIRLIVKHGRYEPWLWGTPQPDRKMDVEIWPNGYADGEAIWDTIHQFWSSRDHGDVAAVDARTAGSGATPDARRM